MPVTSQKCIYCSKVMSTNNMVVVQLYYHKPDRVTLHKKCAAVVNAGGVPDTMLSLAGAFPKDRRDTGIRPNLSAEIAWRAYSDL